MGKGDLARFKAPLVCEKFLRSKNEPYGLGVRSARFWGIGVGCQEVFGRKNGILLLSFGFDMFEKRARSFECLLCISPVGLYRVLV